MADHDDLAAQVDAAVPRDVQKAAAVDAAIACLQERAAAYGIDDDDPWLADVLRRLRDERARRGEQTT